jgi:hypothetical protein
MARPALTGGNRSAMKKAPREAGLPRVECRLSVNEKSIGGFSPHAMAIME